MTTDTDMSPVHLTVAQAAQHANVSTKTIRRWIASGRLTTGRAGLLHVIDREDLEQAMVTVGPSLDSPHVPRVGQAGQSMAVSMSSDLLDRLERQAHRIGQLEAELAQARAQLLALPASTQRPFSGHSDALSVAPAQRVPWWAPWRRATS